jgi:4-amino-4-deoxy-L-arabinose transferase-like glycosyltransferase
MSFLTRRDDPAAIAVGETVAAETSTPAPRRIPEFVTLIGLGLWAAAIRLFALAQPQRMVWGDEPFYLWLGRNWLTGQGYSFTGYSDVHHTPMYPLLSGLFYLLTRNLAVGKVQGMELASDIYYLLFGVLLVVPMYLLTKEMYGRRAAVVSAGLVAVYPAISTAPLFWGTLTEPPYYFFVYMGLFMVLLAMRPLHKAQDGVPSEREVSPSFGRGWWAFLLAGMFFGLAYLTRPEAVAYVAVAGAVILLVRLFEKRLLKRATWVSLGIYLVGFLLFFLPYVYYVYRETGSWMVSEKAGVTFVTCIGLSQNNTAAFDQATWGLDSTGLEVFFFSRESYHVNMLDVIRAYPSQFVQLVLRNVRSFVSGLFSLQLFSYYLLPLMGVAFFKAAWDKRRAKGELLLLASLTPVMVFLLFFIQDRYIATLLPTLVIWLGLGTYELGVWLCDTVANLLDPRTLRRFWRGALTAFPALLLILFFVVLQPRVIEQYTSTGSFRIEHKTIGLWLKDNIPPNSVVMSRYPAIAFYADSRWEPTPNASVAQVLQYAQANGVNYFVLDELEAKELRTQFLPLLNAENLPSELELIHVDESSRGKLVVFILR